jgi:ligand-binding sensor domain-containing protein/DNA-binding CsgD family transcriptional regulator
MIKRIVFILFFPFVSWCENTIGLPDVTNFTKKEYAAGLQNWEIAQDNNGVIYLANNEGLLTYDGHAWTLYPLPNKTIVRAVFISRDQKIYIGGQDEIGYFSSGAKGKLIYRSLNHLIPKNDRNFGDVWDIASEGNALFFRSSTKIFRYNLHNVISYPAFSEWAFLKQVNGKLYAHDYGIGLMIYRFNRWEEAAPTSKVKFLSDDPITGILPIQSGGLLLTTLKNGVFRLSLDGQLSFINSSIQADLKKSRIYSAIALNAGRYALGTTGSGVLIIDEKLNIIQRFSKNEGLLDNNILNIFFDREQNLWLGLNNGLSLVSYNSAIKLINPFSLGGSGYASAIYNNYLFVGTSNGLYSTKLESKIDLSFSIGNFQFTPNATGQIWNLEQINNQLFIGLHDGAYILNGDKIRILKRGAGYWNFIPLSSSLFSSEIVAGNYNGISIFNSKNGQPIFSSQIPNFSESSRYVAIDDNENIWVSHPYHGVFKLVKTSSGNFVVKKYAKVDGLAFSINNHLFKIRNKIVVAAEDGVYSYNENTDKFVLDKNYRRLLGNQSLRYLKEDNEGNVWFVHEKSMGVIDFSFSKPRVIYIPELNNKLLSGFENIYPLNTENIFISGESGIFHLNYLRYKQKKNPIKVFISNVKLGSSPDHVLFGGYTKFDDNGVPLTDKEDYEISHDLQSIRFEYSSHIYGNRDNVEFSWKLSGLNAKWSNWEKRSEKEYTNLAPGEYTFEVKVRNNLGNESAPVQFKFTILPPWYLTIYSLIGYFILITFAFIKTVEWQKNKFKKQQEKFENERAQLLKIQELERIKAENEIVALQNANLELEISHQNSTIASSAMHLVKKNELLSKIKNDLLNVSKQIQEPQTLKEIKKLVKTVSNEDHMDKEWENFTIHFDKTHSDFLIHLKEKHPEISANELKLCAYLRMNLSTKEIAQLSSISVRGVEISRYRLRKKLKISSEMSLFDYLITV